MADSTAEAALKALASALATTGAKVVRNAPLGIKVPADTGLIILRDGDPGEPEVIMSPMTWCYEHQAEAEIYVQGVSAEVAAGLGWTGPGETAIDMFDALKQAVSAAISADRTLGGACEWAQPLAARRVELNIEGAAPIVGMLVPVTLHYQTSDPLV